MSSPDPITPARSVQARFGTFGGVFTPSVLTILGVIMFMRAGFVVGSVGIWQALLILLLAKAITTLTSLSIAAIATNTEVGTGGNYFMVSRSLGADFGGAIGIMLFASQAVAVAFYVIGFSEAMFSLFAPPGSDLGATLAAYRVEQLTSSVVIVALFGLTFKGADLAIRAQYVILTVLLVSVASFLLGGVGGFDFGTFGDNQGGAESSVGFWPAFAIFFPAVTGIDAGANMSGDLRDPARSIPRGTIAAIIFTGIIYVLELVLLAGTTDRARLLEAPFAAVQEMSIWAPLVVAGVLAATMSSALGSFLGAPRILQAMGQDRLLRPLIYFGVGHGAANEPRRATVLTLGIALAVVWGGDLNAVAEVISMFFLIAYGMLNLSAFVEARGGNPSFRPTFRTFGWPLALAGAIGCGVAMVKINETYALAAMGIAALIFFSLRGRAQGSWGDAKRGFVFTRARDNLLLLERMAPDPKNWRPILVALTEDVDRDKQMIECAAALECGRGMFSVLELPPGASGSAHDRLAVRDERMVHINALLRNKGIAGLGNAVVARDALGNIDALLQAYSLGSFRPNTIMFSVPPPAQTDRRERVATMARAVTSLGTNVLLYKGARSEPREGKRIDIWWHGEKNGSLMALFAYLLRHQPAWQGAQVRALRVVSSGVEHLTNERAIVGLMTAARLDVSVEVVVSQRPVFDIIIERSADSDLVLMGLREQDLDDLPSFLSVRDPVLAKLPPTVLVLSNGEVDLLA